MSKRWLKEAPWPERFKDGWSNMSKEHKREFMDRSWQEHLKAEYEMALEFTSTEGRPWEELSQEEKDKVEAAVKQHAQEMQEFGKAISNGDFKC